MNEELEQLALDAYDGELQPDPTLTEVFETGDGYVYVTLNNVNGPLATFQVMDPILEELTDEEVLQLK